jgi:hypothetical protein
VLGEFMIAALVSKGGYVDGTRVCLLPAPETRQDRRLINPPSQLVRQIGLEGDANDGS